MSSDTEESGGKWLFRVLVAFVFVSAVGIAWPKLSSVFDNDDPARYAPTLTTAPPYTFESLAERREREATERQLREMEDRIAELERCQERRELYGDDYYDPFC